MCSLQPPQPGAKAVRQRGRTEGGAAAGSGVSSHRARGIAAFGYPPGAPGDPSVTEPPSLGSERGDATNEQHLKSNFPRRAPIFGRPDAFSAAARGRFSYRGLGFRGALDSGPSLIDAARSVRAELCHPPACIFPVSRILLPVGGVRPWEAKGESVGILACEGSLRGKSRYEWLEGAESLGGRVGESWGAWGGREVTWKVSATKSVEGGEGAEHPKTVVRRVSVRRTAAPDWQGTLFAEPYPVQTSCLRPALL